MGTEAALRPSLTLPWRRLLPPAALLILAADLAIVLAVAGSTHGYDLEAYLGAGRRILDGQPLYDASVATAGGFAIYQYPPPLALLLVPLTVLPAEVALWLWTGFLVAAFLAGTAILPVRREVRWLVILLGGLMWPLLYSIKLGQVGPLLYLAFAVGWRWLDRPAPLGLSIAAGTVVKIQPIVLLGWAVATRRFTAAIIAVGVLGAAALIATIALGPAIWSDYVSLLARISSPVTTPHSFTPGAVAYQLGLPEGVASGVETAVVAAAAAVTAWSWWRRPPDVSYLVTVVASQLVSPLLWDHYAMLLLLPIAWLLDQGAWWAVAVPLVVSLPLVSVTPAIAYPLCFGLILVASALTHPRAIRGGRGRDQYEGVASSA